MQRVHLGLEEHASSAGFPTGRLQDKIIKSRHKMPKRWRASSKVRVDMADQCNSPKIKQLSPSSEVELDIRINTQPSTARRSEAARKARLEVGVEGGRDAEGEGEKGEEITRGRESRARE
jgi:hypothetical protein